MSLFRHVNGVGKGGLIQRAYRDRRQLLLRDFANITEAPVASVMPSILIPGYEPGALGNDEMGNCVRCSFANRVNLSRMARKKGEIITRDMVVKSYSEAVCYVPELPETDRGEYLVDVIKEAALPGGLFGAEVLAWVEVDMGNPWEVTYAISCLGGVLGGYGLPLYWQEREIWDVPAGGFPDGKGPYTWGNHAMLEAADSPGRAHWLTWGYPQPATHDARYRCAFEGYAFFLKEEVEDGVTPTGLDMEKLLAAIEQVRKM
jgi:hypothetical protein